LNLLYDQLLFHDMGGTFMTIKSLFPTCKGNIAESGSDNFKNLFDLAKVSIGRIGNGDESYVLDACGTVRTCSITSLRRM
jgi:hypothetical protein